MKSIACLLICVLLLALIAGCSAPAATTAPATSTPAPNPTAAPAALWPTGGWTRSTPEEQGMDSALLAGMLDSVQAKQVNLRSLLVVRHGALVLEAYAHPYTANTRVQIQSITKSFIGALVGMAVDQGLIDGKDQKVLEYYPDRSIPDRGNGRDQITVEHLLSMTSGFDCMDWEASGAGMQASNDWVQYMLERPMAQTPGTTFGYCSGNPHLLSSILSRKTQKNAREYANENLFAPLGIPAASPATWADDPQGIALGGYGLYLTPQDIARLGYLYLRQGQWDGQQLVSEAWIDAATQPHATKDDGTSYGYLWTVYPEEHRYAALGLGGQQLHVLPELDLVVVFTAGLNASAESPELNELLKEYIIPSVKSEQPLADNAAEEQRLADLVQTYAEPKQAVPELPELAGEVSEKVYTLGENPLGIQAIAFRFEAGSPIAHILVNGGALDLEVGLDNLYRTTVVEGAPSPYVLRGRWVGPDTFEIHSITVGELSEGIFTATFQGDELEFTLQPLPFDDQPMNMHGVAQAGD